LEIGSIFPDGASEYSVVETLRMYVVHTANKTEGTVKLVSYSKNESWRVQRWGEVIGAFS